MATVQIGTYNRPGIFQTETDNSVVTSPVVQGIVNTVIGVSKHGPVNTPVLLTNTSDLQNNFGSIDRQLERKGSFFHRTITNMLQSSPVYAINLLLTDDTLDIIEYQSLSCATTYLNDVERLAPYSRFFDTTGFWVNDTSSFLDILQYPTPVTTDWDTRLLNFTNLSSNYVTVFIFKSKITGYDTTLLTYYGSVENVPPYVNPQDLASDYMVDVLIVAGDYSNYKALSVNPSFSRYFDATGLLKGQVTNFSNDRNVTTLAYYSGLSLIPYFRDLNNNMIYIETVINQQTQTTGIFCAYNVDVFEKDFPTGLVDLIGNNLVGDDLTTTPKGAPTYFGSLANSSGEVAINFLSYKDTITENVLFDQTVLDRPGNVMALFGTQSMPSSVGEHSLNPNFDRSTGILGGVIETKVGSFISSSTRTYWFSEGYVNDLRRSLTSVTGQTISVSYKTDPTSNNAYAVIGGSFVPVSGGTYSLPISSSYYSNSLASTQSYYMAITLDSTGTIKPVQTTTIGQAPIVGVNDIVLGYASFSCYNGSFVTSSVSYYDLTVGTATGGGDAAYKPLVYGVDFVYNAIGTSSFQVEFLNTNMTIATNQYSSYRKLKNFNYLIDYLTNSNSKMGAMLVDPTGTNVKLSLSYLSVTNIINTNTSNRAFTINGYVPTVLNNTYNVYVADDYVDNYLVDAADIDYIASSGSALIFYRIDDEMILGLNGLQTLQTPAGLTGLGAVSVFSDFYRKFEQGLINNLDPIYQKTNYSPVEAIFIPGSSVTASLSGYNYLVFQVDNTQTDYLGNTLKDAIDLNNNYFASVDPNVLGAPGYQFLLTGVHNDGTFTTKLDQGLVPSNTGDPHSVSSADGLTNTGRAYQLSLLSGGALAFTSSASSTYSYYAYEVVESVVTEYLPVDNLFAASSDFADGPIYLDMNIDQTSNNLIVSFVDHTNTVAVPFGSIQSLDLLPTPQPLWSNDRFFVRSFDSNYKESVELAQPSGYTYSSNKILVVGADYPNLGVGNYLEADYATSSLVQGQMPRKLTRVLTKRQWAGNPLFAEVTCDAPIKLSTFSGGLQTFRYSTFENYISTYKAISLKGFRVRQASLPDGTDKQQSAILDLVGLGTPLFSAITNKDAFDFRYLIDSFGLGLTERSKQPLVDICGQRLDCFGIINMPSMKQFKNSSSPSFVDSNGTLQTSYIASGGNLENNPAFLYSFGDGPGVSAVGYFTPYVNINDNGMPLSFPPSSYVGLTYMRKFNSTLTNIVPWTICAGVTNGRIINISGLEMNFTDADIDNLNPAQMNPIIYKRNRGWMIDTENTAQTLYKSALSYIHVREVLIELEKALADMLLDFQWRFNTADVRAEIKLRADTICESFTSRNGLYNYFNKCDQENNTSVLIDNQMGVLDTYVEPIKGMGTIINNITILRTGAIQSGGFINQ